MFSNSEEINEAIDILDYVYPYTCFEKKDNKIICKSDAYTDPVQTLLVMRSRGLIDFYLSDSGFSEVDIVTITGCNLEAFRRLKTDWPQEHNNEKILDKYGYTKPQEKEKESDHTNLVILNDRIISGEDWALYWKIKNTKPSAWNMPTVGKLYITISEYLSSKGDHQSLKLAASYETRAYAEAANEGVPIDKPTPAKPLDPESKKDLTKAEPIVSSAEKSKINAGDKKNNKKNPHHHHHHKSKHSFWRIKEIKDDANTMPTHAIHPRHK